MPRLTQDEFINRSKATHNNFYDYSLVEYKRSNKKVKIICPMHGVFETEASSHLRGCICLKCSIENSRNTNFIERSKLIHDCYYDYSETKYTTAKFKVKIICPKHGMFEQRAESHLQGSGCIKCHQSSGEKLVSKYLKCQGINFIPQKTFTNCKGETRVLPFDFYLCDYNIAIEYQGIQHYQMIPYWGQKTFDKTKKYDNIKKEYCKKNNIYLIEIPYYEKEPLKLLEQCITHYISNNKSGLEIL
jgi:hypothetical protein